MRRSTARNIIGSVILLVLVFGQHSFAEFRAGAAKVDITPPVGERMSAWPRDSKGVHDPLYAKALVLDDGKTKMALVTINLSRFGAENTTNVKTIVKEKTGIDNVLCAATHTHSAPLGKDDFPTKEDPWIRQAERNIADVIARAAANLAPAKIGAGFGQVPEGHNRRVVLPDGKVVMHWNNRKRTPTNPVDYQLGVIRIEAIGGKPIATLINFACHPVIGGHRSQLLSADYPGVLTRLVEEATGVQCMFLQGAAGDIDPFWTDISPAEGCFEQMEKMGKTIADEALSVLKHIVDLKADQSISFHTECVPLASRNDVERKNRDIRAEINTVLIGKDLAIATFPGEFFVEHGISLKQQSRINNTMFVGYCNDALAYFPTIRSCTEGGYGVESRTRVEVGAGERLVNRALINLYYQAGMITKTSTINGKD